MLLSVAPVLGANGGNGNGSNGSSSGGGAHGTSGNVKVHNAGTGAETSGSDNEPHVCSFWLGFTFDAPYEAGTWVVVSWAPTGDGSTVASGLYDTAGDGIDSSSVIDLTAGHYRVEWSATGATSSKKKTFWVDATCGEQAPVEDPAPPTDAPGSPAEESQEEDPAPPTDAPGSPAEESQDESDELVLSGEGTAPEDEEPQTDQTDPTDEEAPATDEEPVVEEVIAPVDPSDAEEPAQEEEPAQDQLPAEDDQPAQDEQPAQAENPGATDPGTPPSQEELDSIGAVDEPTMADTAVASARAPSGLPAVIGLLMLIAAYAVRRDRASDREMGVAEAGAPNA